MSNIVINFPGLDNNHNYSGTITLRFFYTHCTGEEFIASDNSTAVMCGTASGNWYKEVTCSLSGNQLIIPATTLISTDNSNNIDVRCSAVFAVNGILRDWLFSEWIIPANLGASITFAALEIYNQQINVAYSMQPSYLTAAQTAALIGAVALAKATDTLAGISRLSLAAANPNDPIVVGDNDPRLSLSTATNVTSPPYNTDNTGVLSARAGINAAYAAAVAAGTKRVYIPAGIYRITAADIQVGHIMFITDDDVEWFGDGMGRTIFRVDDNVTPLANDCHVLWVGGKRAHVHDFTIEGTALVSGTAGTSAIECHNATGSHFHDIEVTNWNDNSTAGGFAFGYGSEDSTSLNTVSVTTLGQNIAAGLRTVTPTSMANIYSGRRIGLATFQTQIGREWFAGTGGSFFNGDIYALVKYDNDIGAAGVSAVTAAMTALSANWWMAGGVSGAMCAFAPKGAASYAASKTDLSGSGNDAADGTAFPSWSTGNGWTFVAASSQFLTTNASSNQKPFTVLARMKITSYTGEVILGAKHGGLQIALDSSGIVSFNKTFDSSVESTSAVPLNTDVVVALRYDGSGNYVFYIAGAAAGSGVNNITFDSTGLLSETVVVTDTPTETSFTATFAQSHKADEGLEVLGEGEVYTTFERCFIHDAYNGAGFGVTGSGGRFLNNRVINVGNNPGRGQHHFYIQMGGNVFDSNWTEGGASTTPLWQEYLGGTGNRDGTGNRYVNNDLIGLRLFFSSVNQSNFNGQLPAYPTNYSLQREQIFVGNRFKAPLGQAAGVSVGSRAIFSNNYLENCELDIGNGDVDYLNSQVIGNTLLGIQCPQLSAGIRAFDNAIISGNQLIDINTTNTIGNEAPIVAGNNCVIANNRIHGGNYRFAIYAKGTNNHVHDNIVTSPTAGTITAGHAIGFTGGTNINIHDNYIDANSVLQIIDSFNDTANPTTGTFRDNVFTSTFTLENSRVILPNDTNPFVAGLDFRNNIIPQMPSPLTKYSGRLWGAGRKNATGADLLVSRLVGLNANNRLVALATTDTVFFGVFVGPNTSIAIGADDDLMAWAVYEINAEATVAADGAWTRGNVGVLSTTSAGKVHDTASTTPPAAPASYVVFLDTGGGAGNAKVRLMRTL